MDFSLTEQQEMLKASARKFLEKECPKSLVRQMEEDERGYPAELWHKMAAIGWLGLPFPEEYGGGDGDFLDLMVLLEEMGYALLPGPYLSTVVLCGLSILEIGKVEQKAELLPKIVSGELLIALALTEPSASYTAEAITVCATPDKQDYLIDGTKLFVADAYTADYLLCVTRIGSKKGKEGITLFLVNTKSPGINMRPLPTIANDKKYEVTFEKVRVPKENILGELNQGWAQVQKIIARGMVTECAQMLGNSQRVLEMTLEYAKQRVQFGHPIASFQAVQHRCAEMASDVYASRYITYQAAWKIKENLPFNRDVSSAKAWVSEACQRVALLAHETHATIGYTKDYDLQLFFRRAKKSELAFGDSDYHREIVAQELGL